MSDCGCETGCPPLTQTDPALTGVTDVATSGSIAANGVVGNHITTVGTLSLKNDNAAPGNSKYYGTDGAGVKGFFTLPDGSVTSITFADSITADQNPLTTSGIVNLVNDNASPGNDMVYGTDGAGVKGWRAFPTLTSPLTTKGDLFTFSASDAALAVGTNGQILVANSATATGLEWQDISALSIDAADVVFAPSGTIVATNVQAAIDEFNVLTTKGDLLTMDAGPTKIRVGVGSNGQILTANSAVAAGLEWAAPASFSVTTPYIKLSHTLAAGNNAGTFTSGAWRTHVLNTEDNDTGAICTLAANQFALPAGTYQLNWWSLGYKVEGMQTRIRNITDSTTPLVGASVYVDPSTGSMSSEGSGLITIAGAKTFELQSQCQTTVATSGFGLAANFGENEIYAVVQLWKVA